MIEFHVLHVLETMTTRLFCFCQRRFDFEFIENSAVRSRKRRSGEEKEEEEKKGRKEGHVLFEMRQSLRTINNLSVYSRIRIMTSGLIFSYLISLSYFYFASELTYVNIPDSTTRFFPKLNIQSVFLMPTNKSIENVGAEN